MPLVLLNSYLGLNFKPSSITYLLVSFFAMDCKLRIVLFVYCRHQLIPEDDLAPLYDLLIDDPPEIRHAIGALVYDHLIAQKFTASQSGSRGLKSIHELFQFKIGTIIVSMLDINNFFLGETGNSSEIHLKRMLRILEEFPQDPYLSIYVIDDVWEYMKAIKVCIYYLYE